MKEDTSNGAVCHATVAGNEEATLEGNYLFWLNENQWKERDVKKDNWESLQLTDEKYGVEYFPDTPSEESMTLGKT